MKRRRCHGVQGRWWLGVLVCLGGFPLACSTATDPSDDGEPFGGAGVGGQRVADDGAAGAPSGGRGEQGEGGSGGAEEGGEGGANEGGGGAVGGASARGGASAMGGAPKTGGAAPAGGMIGSSDKSQEKVWFDADVTLGGAREVDDDHPPSWFAPVNYWEGEIQVRLDVQKGIAERFGIELCLWKASPSDPKHTCPSVMSSVSGTGEFTRRHPKASGLLLNVLARGTMVADDFKTPFVLSKLRLVKDHTTELAGPVTGHLTIVLVPAGLTFSGWNQYPK